MKLGPLLVFLKFGGLLTLLTLTSQCSAVFQTDQFSTLPIGEALRSQVLIPAVTMFFAGGLFGLISRMCVGAILPAIVSARRRAGLRTDVNEFALKHVFELDGQAKPIQRKFFRVWRLGQ
ncbi:hypothetical protein BWR18_15025 [Tateyamaria omphalii]|uniref:Uncharacterized protein n=1 Tax=Tateyamaria omphalii TaxID=299262 RepID=A0A1P8MXQ9_9RHOB|nr:hypothetical protein BWR18_15025 [Tateyamaria omphalii]